MLYTAQLVADLKQITLQRGLWTNTKNGLAYFDSVTNGWIDYSHNHVLVQLFRMHSSHRAKATKQPWRISRRTSLK